MINQRYNIIRELGKGGAGIVVLAEDTLRQQNVALKASLRTIPEEEETLRQEFSVLSSFNHPQLVTVYDCGRIDDADENELSGKVFYTMEYLQGTDAAAYLRSALSPEKKAELLERLLIELLGILHYVHGRGIIHYDIKPANIMMTGDGADQPLNIKLTDFGFSLRKLDALETPVRGTLEYTAPEILRGQPADHRVDLYSLGVTFFELLEGRCPYTASNSLDLVKSVLTTEFPRFTVSAKNDARLKSIIRNLCEKEPGNRIQTALDGLLRYAATEYEDLAKACLYLRAPLNYMPCGEEGRLSAGTRLPELSIECVTEAVNDKLGNNSATTALAAAMFADYGGNPVIINKGIDEIVKAAPLAVLNNPESFEKLRTAVEEYLYLNFEEYFCNRYDDLRAESKLAVEFLSFFLYPVPVGMIEQFFTEYHEHMEVFLAALTDENVIECSGNLYRLRQNKFRQYVYGRTVMHHLQWHEEIAGRIEVMGDLENPERRKELAYQYDRAGKRKHAREQYLIIADLAISGSNNNDAIEFLQKALLCANAPADRIPILGQLADIFALSGLHRECITTAKEIQSLLPPGDSRQTGVTKTLGKAYAQLGEYRDASECLQLAMQSAGSELEVFEIQQEIVSVKITEGNFEEAIGLSLRQKDFALREDNKASLGLIETDMGIAYFFMGKLDESLDAFVTALSIYEDLHDRKKSIDALINIGNILSEMRKTREALHHWNKAFSMMDDGGSLQQRAQVLNNIGIAHFNLREYENAKVCYLQAKTLFEKLNSKNGTAFTLTNLGEVEYSLGGNESALTHWKQALELYHEMQDNASIVQTLLQIGEVYLTIGLAAESAKILGEAETMMAQRDLGMFKAYLHYLKGLSNISCSRYGEANDELRAARETYLLGGQYSGGGESEFVKITRIMVREAEISLLENRCDESLALLNDILNNRAVQRSPLLEAEIFFLLGTIARLRPDLSESKPVIYYRNGLASIEQEPVSEIGWKLSFDLAQEYHRRGNVSRAIENFSNARMILNYFASGFTSSFLRDQYLRDPQRLRALGEITTYLEQEQTT